MRVRVKEIVSRRTGKVTYRIDLILKSGRVVYLAHGETIHQVEQLIEHHLGEEGYSLAQDWVH